MDLVDGQPTGSVRVSFGYMSTFEDCRKFLHFVAECFVEKPVRVNQEKLEKLKRGSPRSQSSNPESVDISSGEMFPAEETERRSEASLKGFGRTGLSGHGGDYTLTNIYIYPIKSCGAFQV